MISKLSYYRQKLLLACLFCCLSCSKTQDGPSITLWNLPLQEMQAHINGKWRAVYAKGGTAYGTYPAVNGRYQTLSPNRIIIGDDSGIMLDTTITWLRERKYGFDSTYTLNYITTSGIYHLPVKKIVQELKNDTLVILDSEDDGFAVYYVK